MAWVLPLPVTVGRLADLEIQIDDPSISRRHCQFLLDVDGALSVRDLDSMNGIYLEGERVRKAGLRPGVVLQIGSRSLRIEWTNDPITKHPMVLHTDNKQTQPMVIQQRSFKKG
jgi:pSer/pThr/pTyr-binding forkhead associated (FHA) protein